MLLYDMIKNRDAIEMTWPNGDTAVIILNRGRRAHELRFAIDAPRHIEIQRITHRGEK